MPELRNKEKALSPPHFTPIGLLLSGFSLKNLDATKLL